jgi:hypothetical protein
MLSTRAAQRESAVDWPAGADDAAGFGEGPEPVGPLVEVVQRAKQQHGVGAGVGEVQVVGVRDGGVGARQVAGGAADLLDVVGGQVAVQHVVAQVGEPQGVPAAADDGDGGWQGRVPCDDLRGAREFQLLSRLVRVGSGLLAFRRRRRRVRGPVRSSGCGARLR